MTDNKPKKFPHERYTPEWERAADQEARRFAPQVKPCRDCGGPVVKGYCCQHCESVNP